MTGTRAHRFDKAWREFIFCLCLMGLAILLLIEGMGATVDEDAVLNARALPVTLSGIVFLYAAHRAVLIFLAVRAFPFPALRFDGLVFRIVIPLSAVMILYAWLVEAAGYPIGTALTMTMVLWIFGVREVVLNVVLSISAAVVSNFVFVTLLGMYMPEGWLLEWMLKTAGLS